MTALQFYFPAGRYHANPWGRHVNEAAIAWPPDPIRIIRALIATHHRKAFAEFSVDALCNLVDSLSEMLPVYRLPAATQGHTRHYMPLGKKNNAGEDTTALVFDAFARINTGDAITIGWPDLSLDADQSAHLELLARQIGYLGRAESWVDARITDWDGSGPDAYPMGDSTSPESLTERSRSVTPLYAPLSANEYGRFREKWKAADRKVLATLPARLAEALAIDTSELHAAGWSTPPAMRRVLYATREIATSARVPRRRNIVQTASNPTIARFVLAGRPRPQITDTVRVAEIMRVATMSRFEWHTAGGARRPKAPGIISGYGDDGKPLRDDSHLHAFWLPEDADDDGLIDHIIVHARGGFDGDCRQKLDGVTKLWIEKRGKDSGEDDAEDAGRREWRLALEGFGQPTDFSSASRLLRRAPEWLSVTPYLSPWHAKRNFGPREQIRREIEKRCGFPPLLDAEILDLQQLRRRPVQFRRTRSRRGLTQPDPLGCFIKLTFAEPVAGPIALGFGCHFGLGLFTADTGA